MEVIMKRFAVLTTTIMMGWATLHAAGSTYSDDRRFTDEKLQAIEKNLQRALESDNFGLQTSAEQVIRDVKALVPQYEFSSLVIPLMRILKDESAASPNRILAALALHELGSERGDYAIRRVGELSDIRQLKHVCAWLTYSRAVARTQVDSDINIASRSR
jgi:hypothetical protein